MAFTTNPGFVYESCQSEKFACGHDSKQSSLNGMDVCMTNHCWTNHLTIERKRTSTIGDRRDGSISKTTKRGKERKKERGSAAAGEKNKLRGTKPETTGHIFCRRWCRRYTPSTHPWDSFELRRLYTIKLESQWTRFSTVPWPHPARGSSSGSRLVFTQFQYFYN